MCSLCRDALTTDDVLRIGVTFVDARQSEASVELATTTIEVDVQPMALAFDSETLVMKEENHVLIDYVEYYFFLNNIYRLLSSSCLAKSVARTRVAR